MFVTDLIQGRVDSVSGMPVVGVCETPFSGVDGLVKRASDVVLSAMILALIAPLLLVLACAVRISSPGPVIFRQRRYGMDGEEIGVYKLRTMRVMEDGEGIRQCAPGDPRVTRLGAFMRRTSLDELPQFVNVLQGRMSIVGPRPHAVAHNEMYRKLIKGYMLRHKVRPGITGWAQVHGCRGETGTLEKMRARVAYDLDYLRNWSLSLDLYIMLKTVWWSSGATMRTETVEPAAPGRVEEPAAPDFRRDVHCLLGVPLDAVDRSGALQRIRSAAERRSRCFLSTPNVNFLVAARADEAFRHSIVHSDLSVADGMPLVWLAKLMGIPIPERVAGASLFEALAGEAGVPPMSVFFFGGPKGAAQAAARRLGARCAGYAFPGHGSVESMSGGQLIARINASNADLLVVALGARKGQAWIERNRHRLNVPVISHLGAVVDLAAGRQERAPAWMQKSGLEWLWRIKERPALWRRYFRDGMALCGLVATRVLPLLLHGRRRAGSAAPPGLETVDGGRRFVVRLQGAWVRANLAPLRECLARASAAGKDVCVDLGGVTSLDSAGLGLLMLLEGHQRERGRGFAITSLSRPVRRIFGYHGADYLCTRARVAPALQTQPRELRFALLLAALMVAASAGGILARPTITADTAQRAALATMVPRQFGEWREVPQATQVVNPQAEQLVDKLYSEVLTRNYANAQGYRVMLSLAYGSDQRRALQAHMPEVCYPAQGFTVHASEPASVATAYGEIPARRLHTSLGQRHEPVTYWFTVGDTASPGPIRKRFIEMRLALSGRIPDGMLFRVSSIDRDQKQAYALQEQFVTELLDVLSPEARKRLSGLETPAGF
jgi:N-acetylglucosaminyldiphosphoundecaprenol N-acetyl-beta-D-mannosaminyltransferase